MTFARSHLRRGTWAFSRTVLAAILIVVPILAGDASSTPSIPSDAAQAEAMKLVREVYGDDLNKAKTYSEKQALANKLRQKALENEKDFDVRFVLLSLSIDMAIQAADAELALELVDQIDSCFEIDALQMKADVLPKVAAAARSTEQHESVVTHGVDFLEEAIEKDAFALARPLAALILAEARKTGNSGLIKWAVKHDAEFKEIANAYDTTQAAMLTLETSPADPDANQTVGKYRCLMKGDWNTGLPILALGTDETLKSLAAKDCRGATSAEEKMALGDGWWELADKEKGLAARQIRHRAIYWYEQALPGLTGLLKDKLAKRIEGTAPVDETPFSKRREKSDKLATSVSHANSGKSQTTKRRFGGKYIEILPQVDMNRDCVSGNWEKLGDAVATVGRFGWQRLMLPVVVQGEYDLQTTFTRHAGNDCVNVMFPVGAKSCALVLSGWGGGASGLDLIDGKGADHNPTTQHPGTLVNGHQYTVLIKVRLQNELATIDVLLDNSPLIHWQGKVASLSVRNDWIIPQSQQIGLGVHCALTTFHSVRLKMVSGSAAWIKGNPMSIVGKWDWFGRGWQFFGRDGSATVIPTDGTPLVEGRWKCVDEKSQTFEIAWNNGYVDTFVLSKDGNQMNGHNNKGTVLSVRRCDK